MVKIKHFRCVRCGEVYGKHATTSQLCVACEMEYMEHEKLKQDELKTRDMDLIAPWLTTADKK